MSNTLEGHHQWQKDLLKRLDDEGLALSDVAYYLNTSRERPRQMLTQEFADPEAESEASGRLEAAVDWAVKHCPRQHRVRLGQIVNGCAVIDNSTCRPRVRCEKCGKEWASTNQTVVSGRLYCRDCMTWVGEDLTGRVFGEWTVLGCAPFNTSVRWVCQCSCGVVRRILEGNLLAGRSTRCRKCGYERRTRRHTSVLVPIYREEAVEFEGEESEPDVD